MEVELAHGGRGRSSSDRRGGGGGSARFGVSRHSGFRVIVRGLPSSASRQDLKDHMRKAGDVCFAEVTRDSDGTYGVVDYTNYDDMKYAIRKLDDTEFWARAFIRVKKYESSQSRSPSRNRSRSRSRSLSRSKSKRIGVSYEMEMEIDDNFVIFDCKLGSNNLTGALVSSKVLDSYMTVRKYDLEGDYKKVHSMLNNRMWMVHDRVNCTWLTYGCKKIGKPPPIPKSIIDTSLFMSSKTKLGRAAVMFSLGMQKHGFNWALNMQSNWAYRANLSAILACTEIMSMLDVPVKTLNDTVHPMLYYLMQYNDQMKDEVRARYFNEAEYPSFNKIDDLPIMLLVVDVLENRKRELKKLNDELDNQKEEEPLVYYKYEEIEGLYTYRGDKLKEHETRKEDELKKHQTHKKDDDDDVEDEDSDDCDECARTRGGIKDQDQDDEDD